MNKLAVLAAPWVVTLVVYIPAWAQRIKGEGDFLSIKVLEEKLDKGIVFFTKKTELSRGRYITPKKLAKDYHVSDYEYILEVYNADEKLITKYIIPSGRFVLWDDGRGRGGIKESTKGIIPLMLPYDENNPIRFLRVDDKGRRTKFLPVVIEAKK